MVTPTQPTDCPVYTAPVLFGTRRSTVFSPRSERLAAVIAGENAAALGLGPGRQHGELSRPVSRGDHIMAVDVPIAVTLGGIRSLAGVPPCATLRGRSGTRRW